MAQSELFKRYIWLVELIYRIDGITRDEINRQWSLSNLNNRHENEIPERTFHRHKIAINDLLDIEIVCDKRANNAYHIANRDELSSNGIKEWLLSTFALNSLVAQSRDLKDRILLEPAPAGQQYLTIITEAMRDNKVIDIAYQNYKMSCPKSHEVEPFCLKIYKQRWYLLGRRTDNGAMRIFALDRVKNVEITDRSFDMPSSFDANSYFNDSVGILVDENSWTQCVTIAVRNGKQNYLRSLPLHHTQKEVEDAGWMSKFELYVQPNQDLIQELLRMGPDVSVIRPKWFRAEMKKIADAMSFNYSEE